MKDELLLLKYFALAHRREVQLLKVFSSIRSRFFFKLELSQSFRLIHLLVFCVWFVASSVDDPAARIIYIFLHAGNELKMF